MGQGAGEILLGGHRTRILTRRGAPKIVLPDTWGRGEALKKDKLVFKSFLSSDYPYQKINIYLLNILYSDELVTGGTGL